MQLSMLALRTASLTALACLALAGCIPSSPEPTPTPAPPPVATTPPPPAPPPPTPAPASANWMDEPQTPGDWQFRMAGGERIAEFRSPAGAQVALLTCTAQREIMLSVMARTPQANGITVRSEALDRTIAAGASDTAVSARLAPRDPLLDAMAFSKGRFAVLVNGGPQLFLPAYPEVTRVIEECRA